MLFRGCCGTRKTLFFRTHALVIYACLHMCMYCNIAGALANVCVHVHYGIACFCMGRLSNCGSSSISRVHFEDDTVLCSNLRLDSVYRVESHLSIVL